MESGYLSGQFPALSRLGVLCGSLGRGLDRKRQAPGGEGCFYIHQHKGTTSAVRRVVEPFGFLIRIIEWWQTGEAPGTFRLDIGVQDQGITEDTYLELERLISDAKPCSRHMSGMSINLQTSGPHWVGAASYLGEEITIYPYINETIISGGTAHEGGAVHVIDTMRVNP